MAFSGLKGEHPAPKPGAIPTSLYPDIQFLPLYHGGGENQRFFCLWSFMWSKPLLCRFRQSWKSRKRRRHKALRRFALTRPGYRHGTPKAGALPTALCPDTLCHYNRSKCACPVLYIAFCVLLNFAAKTKAFQTLLKKPDCFRRVQMQTGGHGVAGDVNMAAADAILCRIGKMLL